MARIYSCSIISRLGQKNILTMQPSVGPCSLMLGHQSSRHLLWLACKKLCCVKKITLRLLHFRSDRLQGKCSPSVLCADLIMNGLFIYSKQLVHQPNTFSFCFFFSYSPASTPTENEPRNLGLPFLLEAFLLIADSLVVAVKFLFPLVDGCSMWDWKSIRLAWINWDLLNTQNKVNHNSALFCEQCYQLMHDTIGTVHLALSVTVISYRHNGRCYWSSSFVEKVIKDP